MANVWFQGQRLVAAVVRQSGCDANQEKQRPTRSTNVPAGATKISRLTAISLRAKHTGWRKSVGCKDSLKQQAAVPNPAQNFRSMVSTITDNLYKLDKVG